MQLSRGVVVASIQVDLDDDVLARFQKDLLDRVHETSSRAAILDVSGLETIDSDEFAALRRIMSMVGIMGAESVLVGLQPGVVSALIEMEADVWNLQTAIDLDAAFVLLEPQPEVEVESEIEDEAKNEPIAARAEEDEDATTLESGRIDENDR
jgi:anti-anti-sigma regulatory factor